MTEPYVRVVVADERFVEDVAAGMFHRRRGPRWWSGGWNHQPERVRRRWIRRAREVLAEAGARVSWADGTSEGG